MIYVEADYIVTKKANGTEEREIRFVNNLFRHLYQTIAYTTIVDSYSLDGMTAEEQAALLADDNCLLTMTITARVGNETKTFVYRFYSISSRKAFLTLNGGGEFYVSTGRLEKIITDCKRFFALDPIEATNKT